MPLISAFLILAGAFLVFAQYSTKVAWGVSMGLGDFWLQAVGVILIVAGIYMLAHKKG